MNRRQFLKGGVAATSLAAAAGGVYLFGREHAHAELRIAHIQQVLQSLSGKELTASGQWSVAKILLHCAQSIDMSMGGYPLHKSAVFKHSLGNVAFHVFYARGRMRHDLGEDIPGAPKITHVSIEEALLQLQQSLVRFSEYQGPLAEHFAYGRLTKAEYEAAHVMHIRDHLRALTLAIGDRQTAPSL